MKKQRNTMSGAILGFVIGLFVDVWQIINREGLRHMDFKAYILWFSIIGGMGGYFIKTKINENDN